MKKRKNSILPIILLFILGFAILLYPTFSDWWNQRRAESLMVEYENVVRELDTTELEEQKRLANQYNAGLVGNVLPDAFAEEEANSPNAIYEAVLNPAGDGYMGTVEIPVINVKLPIYHYTTEEVLEKGVGHLPGSSLPVGGESTHSVLSAHRGLPSAKLFTDLDKVQEGNTFYIHVLGETLAYKVDFIEVIEPTDTKDLSIIEGKDLCTLFTCTPYAVNSHRLLVRGYRIPYTEEQYQEELQSIAGQGDTTVLLIRILCVVIGLIIAAIIAWFMNRRINKKTPSVVPVVKEEEEEKTTEEEKQEDKPVETVEEEVPVQEEAVEEEVHEEESPEVEETVPEEEEKIEESVEEVSEEAEVVEETTPEQETVQEEVVEEETVAKKEQPHRRRALPYVSQEDK